MIWQDVRQHHPAQWLVIEALEAHTTADNQRRLEHIAVIEMCADGQAAMQTYRRLHQQFPRREFYFVHTSCDQLHIQERQRLGIRSGSNAVQAERYSPTVR
ncbi:MAG: hypothetical protein KDJ65_35335 [Anaerolineae bacterium]|nr:hypothetical protein [Anaerolineae bacterium]